MKYLVVMALLIACAVISFKVGQGWVHVEHVVSEPSNSAVLVMDGDEYTVQARTEMDVCKPGLGKDTETRTMPR